MKKWMIILLCSTLLAGCTDTEAKNDRGSVKDSVAEEPAGESGKESVIEEPAKESVVEEPSGDSARDSAIDHEALKEEIVSEFSYIDLYDLKDDGTRIDIQITNYDTPDIYYRVDGATILDHVEITPDDYALVFEKTEAYEPIIEKDRQDYWPHTSEYPAMLVLFSVDTYRTGESYKCDGASCKPDGYDDFFEDIEGILEKYITED